MRIPARLDGGGVEGLVELASVVGHDAAALSRTCPSGKAVQSAPACSASIRSPGAEGSTIMVPSSRSEEHTSELQSLMRISYAVFCLKKKNHQIQSSSEYN